MDTEPRRRSQVPRKFFSRTEQERIVAAIADAELRTSGEIRLYVERELPGAESRTESRTESGAENASLRARGVFGELDMHRTSARNGVLIYLATRSRRFAVVGDERLHARVGDDFWQEIVAEMSRCFATGLFTAGVIVAIDLIGEKLCEHFPHPPDDRNELPDDLAFGS